MVVTETNVKLIPGGGKMKASASVTFDNELTVHEIKVVEGVNGLFVSMPNRKCSDGVYRDYIHAVSPEIKDEITACVMEEYGAAVKNSRGKDGERK